MTTLALIACSKSKAADVKTARADYLYTGRLLQAQLVYARQVLGLPDREIFILSAKHSLVCAHWWIETYDKTLAQMKRAERQQWAKEVFRRLRIILNLRAISPISQVEVVMMAGELYREELHPMLVDAGCKVRIPHPINIGYAQQVAWYRQEVATNGRPIVDG